VTYRDNRSDKTPHQKQLRFFTVLLLILISLATAAGFWFANRSSH
jgi:hypothetical protein